MQKAWVRFSAPIARSAAQEIRITLADGKVLKPEGWQPADKLAVIREACG